MKRILPFLAVLLMGQALMAQQFSLPILPEKMWPSEYANYETDILNCCNYLLTAPQVQLIISPELTDANNSHLLLAYIAAWTRHSLQYKDASQLLCANVAVEEMLRFYESFKSSVGKSRLCEKLLKEQKKGELATMVSKALVK